MSSKDRFDSEKDWISSLDLFYKDWQDQLAQGQLFLKINGINSLTVDLFQRSMRAYQSHWSFSKIDLINSLMVLLLKEQRDRFNLFHNWIYLLISWSQKIKLICIKKLFCFEHRRVKKWANRLFFWSKDRIVPSSFLKSDGIDSLFLIFFKDRQEWCAHGWSF